MKLNDEFLKALGNLTVLTNPEDCARYSHDDSRHQGLAEAVVFPQSHDDVVRIIKACYEFNVPITARGLGSGTPGGAVPVHGGVVLSLEKMDQIIEFDPDNRFIKVQAGILNKTVQDAVAEKNFFWPPDPGSAAICTVGGNIAYNAGGPRAVKYGATRENVLGLTVVTGTGETIHTGSYTTKSAVGYDLTRLLIGSEGTLGIVTEAILKLMPLPNKIITLLIKYKDIQSATLAATKIMSQAYIPSALEFLDESASKLINIDAGAVLLVNLEDELAEKNIREAAANSGLIDIIVARTSEELTKLWSARKSLSPALKTLSPHKINEDIVVPVSKIPELLEFLKAISKKYDIKIVNFGHAGNGNIHVNLLAPRDENSKRALSEIFEKVISLRGTLSGEHGIGLEKMEFMNLAIDPTSLDIMRKIKTIFDPKGIMNPGKIFS
ncbi:MAG TPA: FAD-linked oxidase C-terminal domain-containing protein [Gammaproteobacteria bacterium]|nr:FAD-linked oxidase C-terminal domain-containing protein [Gammaproteobacteria bacterium]